MKRMYLLLICVSLLAAQTVFEFIRMGFAESPQLRTSRDQVQQAIADAGVAFGQNLPSLNLQTRYSIAGGGRTIEFPIGDLLNPVYATLFQLTNDAQLNQQFQNEVIPFLRETEQESKVNVQWVFSTQLWDAYRLRDELISMTQQQGLDTQRDIRYRIVMTYFSIAKLDAMVDMLKRKKAVVDESLRVIEKLISVSRATVDQRLKAQAMVLQIQARMESVEHQRDMLKMALNLLVGRELNEDVTIVIPRQIATEKRSLTELRQIALKKRPDLHAAITGRKLGDRAVAIERGSYLPQFILNLDAGFTGEDYSFDSDQDYWMASGILKWNLFNGGSDRHRIERAEIENRKRDTQIRLLSQSIEMEVTDALQKQKILSTQLTAQRTQQTYTDKAFTMVQKRYSAGTATQLEFLDALATKFESEYLTQAIRLDIEIQQAMIDKAVGRISVGD